MIAPWSVQAGKEAASQSRSKKSWFDGELHTIKNLTGAESDSYRYNGTLVVGTFNW